MGFGSVVSRPRPFGFFELRDLGIQSIPLNFLNPVPGTPLQDAGTIPPREALRIIALYRFLLPQTEIKVANSFAWRDGSYLIQHMGRLAEGFVISEVNPVSAIWRGVREHYDQPSLQ